MAHSLSKCKDNIVSWEHCAQCYKLEVRDPANEKQWLDNIKEIITKTQTETPSKYIISDKQHEHYKAEAKERDKTKTH